VQALQQLRKQGRIVVGQRAGQHVVNVPSVDVVPLNQALKDLLCGAHLQVRRDQDQRAAHLLVQALVLFVRQQLPVPWLALEQGCQGGDIGLQGRDLRQAALSHRRKSRRVMLLRLQRREKQ